MRDIVGVKTKRFLRMIILGATNNLCHQNMDNASDK